MPYEILAYVATFAAIGALGLLRSKREKSRRGGLAGKLETLALWAEPNGWRVFESIDLRYADRIARLTGLAGNFDGSSAMSGDNFVPSSVWNHGVILLGPGNVEIIATDCWREGQSDEYVIMGLRVQSRFSPPLTLRWQDGQLETLAAEGDPKIEARMSAIDFAFLLKSLEWAYLRCIDDMIILVVKAPITGVRVESLASQLRNIHNAIPSEPRRM